MKDSQKGFAILGTLLLLVIAVVIAGVGWYAVHTKHKTDKILSQADKISQSGPKQSSVPKTSGEKIELNSGAVSFVLPAGWNNDTTNALYCKNGVLDSQKCEDEAFVVPKDGPKTPDGTPFGAYLRIYKARSSTTAKDWYLNEWGGGIPQSQDQTSTDNINGYSTYFYKQNDSSYIDMTYVMLKDDLVAVVYARVSETSYKPGGAAVDQHSDYTQYSSSVTQIAESVSFN